MKIFIFGPPGSGKSTLALELAEKLDIPIYHIDKFFFKAPNIHVKTSEALLELKANLPKDNWIIEGNHGATLDYLAEQADHVIVLNVDRFTCTWRIIKRHLQNNAELRKAVSEGWEETLSWQFIWFTFSIFPEGFKSQIDKIKSNSKGFVHLSKKSSRDLEYFLGLVRP